MGACGEAGDGWAAGWGSDREFHEWLEPAASIQIATVGVPIALSWHTNLACALLDLKVGSEPAAPER